jgi:hypothetical protein
MFSQSKQEEVDKQAKVVYDTAMSVADILEKHNGRLTYITQPEIEKLDRSIIELLRLCNLYASDVSLVYLNGQSMPLSAMFMIINQIVQDIEQANKYQFKCRA